MASFPLVLPSIHTYIIVSMSCSVQHNNHDIKPVRLVHRIYPEKTILLHNHSQISGMILWNSKLRVAEFDLYQLHAPCFCGGNTVDWLWGLTKIVKILDSNLSVSDC